LKRKKRGLIQIKILPNGFRPSSNQARSILFDENMVIYTASGSANLPEKLINIPGSSTQKKKKDRQGNTYL
jgi:hypothetical protein